MASESSRSKVPVAASSTETNATRSRAVHGVPPEFTRESTRGPRPSRESPKITRGVTKRLPLSEARTTRRASPDITAPARGPKIAAAASPATSVEAAIRSNGRTWTNAAFSSR